MMLKNSNQIAVLAANDDHIRELLIHNHEKAILCTAASVCHRYVTKSDDEWSVALYAFSKAIDNYADGKGDFLPFALMLIKRDLIDWFRSQKRALSEVTVAPHVLEGGGEPEEDPDGVYYAVVKESCQRSDRSLKEEINAAYQLLEPYGFRFFELTECSPKQDKTRRECAVAIRYMLRQPQLLDELKRKRKLPVKALVKGSGISKKTVDRYRKYIIMAVLVLDGDFPQISEYLKFVREEGTV